MGLWAVPCPPASGLPSFCPPAPAPQHQQSLGLLMRTPGLEPARAPSTQQDTEAPVAQVHRWGRGGSPYLPGRAGTPETWEAETWPSHGVTPARSLPQAPAHRQEDLQGAVQGLGVAMLQGTADACHQGLAIQGPKASLWLIVQAARAVLTPPGAVRGEVEGQELAVLGRRAGPGEPQGHCPPTHHSPVWAPTRVRGALPSSQGRQGPQGLLSHCPARRPPSACPGPGACSHPLLQEGLRAQVRPWGVSSQCSGPLFHVFGHHCCLRSRPLQPQMRPHQAMASPPRARLESSPTPFPAPRFRRR